MFASSRIADAVRGRRRPPPLGVDASPPAGDRRRDARARASSSVVGSRITSLAVPSMTTSCPGCTRLAGVVQADDRRHVERAREDRGVIGAAAGVGGEAADLASSRPARRATASARRRSAPTTRRARAAGRAASRRPGAGSSQPADEVGDVALALAQVRIGDLVEHGAELVEHLLHRPLGVDALLADDRRRRAAPASGRRASAAARRRATRAPGRALARRARGCRSSCCARSARGSASSRAQLVVDARRRDLIAQHLRALDQDDGAARRRRPARRRCRSGVACVLAESGLRPAPPAPSTASPLVGAVGGDRDRRCRAPPPAAECP